MNSNRIDPKEAAKLDVITAEMKDMMLVMEEENTLFTSRSNQQASKRARVASIHLSTLAKKYRKESMKIASKLPIKA
jgi:hypothetical protein